MDNNEIIRDNKTHDSLVAINILKDINGEKVLIQQNGVPLLFYWNGENSIYDSLLADKDFTDLIIDKCVTYKNYVLSSISYFFFIYNNEDEQYNESSFNVQDAFSFSVLKEKFGLNMSSLYDAYLYDIVYKLYEMSMGTSYIPEPEFLNETNQIQQMHDEIRDRYKDKFVEESFINYVRSILSKTYGLNMKNIECIIEYFINIINNQ